MMADAELLCLIDGVAGPLHTYDVAELPGDGAV